MLETFQTIYRRVLRVILIAMLAVLLAVMSAQVVMRYGFNSSLIWSEELCRYLLIWISFLGLIAAYERGEVAALSFLTRVLPRVPAYGIAILGRVASLVLLVTIIRYGWLYAERAGGQAIPAARFILEELGQSGPIPTIFWVYIALPLGMGLVALRILFEVAALARGLYRGESLAILHDGEEGSAA
ncbi:TRAP transporter small permease subunit [Alphaproteobacteria bacterium GH1-50]|uniref:TRAP transporter small permease protein n=1 Tax=Kangsaoukella pontilimi TaxID=2691042 RepID=A0A7C9IQ37_9RHOB|nr:TRAP transporter small permease [Kangsaoukella pontilimi]MXQ07343.1 TRAP transporter small permease subunit [Kangsaoukella pontilimi]